MAKKPTKAAAKVPAKVTPIPVEGFFTKKQMKKIDAAVKECSKALSAFNKAVIASDQKTESTLSGVTDYTSPLTKPDQKVLLTSLADAQKSFKQVAVAAASVKESFKDLRFSLEKKIEKANKRAKKDIAGLAKGGW